VIDADDDCPLLLLLCVFTVHGVYSASKTLDNYMQARNYIVRLWREKATDGAGNAYLTATECRRRLVGQLTSQLLHYYSILCSVCMAYINAHMLLAEDCICAALSTRRVFMCMQYSDDV
jgi:SWIRM domain